MEEYLIKWHEDPEDIEEFNSIMKERTFGFFEGGKFHKTSFQWGIIEFPDDEFSEYRVNFATFVKRSSFNSEGCFIHESVAVTESWDESYPDFQSAYERVDKFLS